MKYQKPPIDAVLVKHIASRFNLSLEEATVFVRRETTEYKDLLFFLEHSANYLHSPFAFQDAEAFVERIMTAAANSEKVLVCGDSDVDGITSTTLMVRLLRDLNIQVDWTVPEGDESYGVTMSDVDDAIKKDISLIITVDCGISCTKEIEYARSHMIDFIVVDHHEPPPELPNPYAIIDPKVKNDHYPYAAICAAALVYKCIYALLIARTQYYAQDLCILNLVPLDGGIRADFLFTRNLVITDTKSLIFTDASRKTSIEEFIEITKGKPLFVYDATLQEKLLSRAFDQGLDLQCIDMKVQLQKISAAIEHKSLLELINNSRLKNYHSETMSELDMLYHIQCLIIMEEEEIHKKAEEYGVDLVMLATLADVMPMKNENRILVRRGHKKIQSNPNVGLSILFRTLKLQGAIGLIDLSYKVTPLLNGVGREGHASLAVELLLTNDHDKAAELIKKIVDINQQKSKKLNTLRKQLMSQAEHEVSQHKELIIVKSAELPAAYTGLLAGTIQRKFLVPSIVFAVESEITMASIRCHKSFFAPRAIESLDSLIINGGGHNAAAGFSFYNKDEELVVSKLHAYFNEQSTNKDKDYGFDTPQVDIHFSSSTFSIDTIRKLTSQFYPYGNEWGQLHFFVQDAAVESYAYLASKQHLKYELRLGGEKIPLLIWNYKEFEQLANDICEKVTRLSFVGFIREDTYMSLPQTSLVVKQIHELDTRGG